jgi:hypothetical protein
MATVSAVSDVRTEALGTVLVAPRASVARTYGAVVWWAGVGACFLALQMYVYSRWMSSGDLYTQPTGDDPLSTGTKVMAWVLQGVSTSAMIAVLVYLFRKTKRERRLTWDALIAIGFVSVFWQDTIINYTRPTFFYNSYLINFGAWDPHIPGWLSPHARNVPEPLLLTGPIYAWWFVTFSIVFCWMARKARERWPTIGKVGLFAIGVLALGILDIVRENIFMRANLWAYSGVINELSVFAGETYQFPLYEGLIVGIFCTIVGMVRLNRDDKGRSVIEKGIDDTRLSERRRTAVRVLAFIGLANVMFVGLNVVYNYINFYVDEMPKYPSYLNNGLCGDGTDVQCPSPETPVYLPDTPADPKAGSDS